MMVDEKMCFFFKKLIGFNGRPIFTSCDKNMQLMSLELDDKDKMVICLSLFYKWRFNVVT